MIISAIITLKKLKYVKKTPNLKTLLWLYKKL